MRSVLIFTAFVIAALLSGCMTDKQSMPSIDDPELVKYALDRAGGFRTERTSEPRRILAVETTMQELDDLDVSSKHGPGQPNLDVPVYYFVFQVDYRYYGGEETHGWLRAVFDVATGNPRSGGSGPTYLYHPEMIELEIPDGLEDIEVIRNEIFPEKHKPGPPVTPAPPATEAPEAP
jgi:hypothetical protein